MTRLALPPLALASLLVVGASEHRPPDHWGDRTPTSAVARLESDTIRQIERLVSEIEAAYRTGDVDRFMALWGEDGVYMDPGSRPRVGRGPIRSGLPDFIEAQRCDCRFDLDEVRIVGEWAYAHVTFAGAVALEPDALPAAVLFEDKLLLIVGSRADGSWVIERWLLTYNEPIRYIPQTPYPFPEGARVEEDIIYSSPGGFDLRLDLYLPALAAAADPSPGIVCVHGGSWWGGHKADMAPQAAHLASKGFVAVAIQYRLSGEAKYPAAVEDAKAAVRWLRMNASRYGIDPDRIGIIGSSAGAQIAGLVATRPDDPQFAGDARSNVSSRVQAAALFYPPVDLVDFGERYPNPSVAHRALRYYFGGSYAQAPELWRDASPVEHVDENSPPMLFLHGTEDRLVPYRLSVEMVEKLEAYGVHAEVLRADGLGHDFEHVPPWMARTLSRLETFFTRTLR